MTPIISIGGRPTPEPPEPGFEHCSVRVDLAREHAVAQDPAPAQTETVPLASAASAPRLKLFSWGCRVEPVRPRSSIQHSRLRRRLTGTERDNEWRIWLEAQFSL